MTVDKTRINARLVVVGSGSSTETSDCDPAWYIVIRQATNGTSDGGGMVVALLLFRAGSETKVRIPYNRSQKCTIATIPP